jgi:hypothetical protein
MMNVRNQPKLRRVIYTHYLFSTKETVQYTDSKEIKTMFHSILCRFLSAFLKIYWQFSMCDFGFFSKSGSWKPPTYQTKLTSFEKTCHILRRSLRGLIGEVVKVIDFSRHTKHHCMTCFRAQMPTSNVKILNIYTNDWLCHWPLRYICSGFIPSLSMVSTMWS